MTGILRDLDIRLRPVVLPDDVAAAVRWYQDPEVLRLSEGEGVAPYDEATVARMFDYLDARGELYIIEARGIEEWFPIGDASLLPDSLPIVIGLAAFRSRGIGRRVLRLLIARAMALGWETLRVKGVYTYNERSLRLYEGAGFVRTALIDDGEGPPAWSMDLFLPGPRE